MKLSYLGLYQRAASFTSLTMTKLEKNYNLKTLIAKTQIYDKGLLNAENNFTVGETSWASNTITYFRGGFKKKNKLVNNNI
ncbi:MAG: hypothetical protein ACK5H1_09630 [Tenacibaculum sp.]